MRFVRPSLGPTATAAALLLCCACGGDAPPVTGASSALTTEEIAASVSAAMDPTADPCTDFYRYACGGWIDATERPADEVRWGRSFSEIAKRNREVLRDVLEAAPGSDDAEIRRLGTFYAACMDEESVEAAGVEPLREYLDAIADVEDVGAALEVAGSLHEIGAPALFDTAVFGDFKNPETNILMLFQGGLGLPDRDYYVDPSRAADVEAYRDHVARMLGLLGDEPAAAAASARAVVAFETELAEHSRRSEELRDVDRLYNKLDRSGLDALTPDLDWSRFFAAAGYPEITQINVGMPEFFEALQAAAVAAPPSTLRAYLRWRLVDTFAARLPAAFVEADFDFYSARLRGQEQIQARWRRCVDASDAALGELLGKAYVERQFPGESKAIAQDLLSGIEEAFTAELPQLDWMDEPTRAAATTKLQAILHKIGYPDAWRDYSTIDVEPGDYAGNAARANRFEFHRQMDQVGRPVDDTEWGMTPPTVNAYYNPLVNEMVFPAGILQRPFFHRDFPMSMSFGGIGMVMGHELTHGFDDMGSRFDADGTLRPWWDPAVREAFDGRTECVEELYDGYEIRPGAAVNGRLTLGENIADLGGIKQAHSAYRAWRATRGGDDASIVEGLTDEQLFFVAFAQTWCLKATPEIELELLTTDPHSPPRFRVIGPASNLPAFAEAFECEVGSAMNPVERCEVW